MPSKAFPIGAPLARLAAGLNAGAITSRDLVERALERIAADGGDGGHAFCSVDAEGARRQAQAQDALRRAGVRLSPLAGLPISVKDLFDLAGQATRAGARSLCDAPAATRDAPTIASLRRAGAVFIGRTNMSEFAYSGLGLNPWHGTPRSPWMPGSPRVAGGSSSGAAASVAQGMATAGLGSDTGGSLRIPAAFCGLTGFKPTQRRISTQGMFPLSPTLDSAGAIAPTVACCALVDRLLANGCVGDDVFALAGYAAEGLRLAVLDNYVTEQLDPTVSQTWEAAIAALSRAGARLTRVRLPLLEELSSLGPYTLSSMEAYAVHRARLDTHSAQYDRRVLVRILSGEAARAADYIDFLKARADAIARAGAALGDYDAYLMPTVPIVPPEIHALEADDAHFAEVNALVLRNPSIVNLLDGCAVSIPCMPPGAPPVGLTVAGLSLADDHVLRVAAGIEQVLVRTRGIA